jgi:hypothetical protein
MTSSTKNINTTSGTRLVWRASEPTILQRGRIILFIRTVILIIFYFAQLPADFGGRSTWPIRLPWMPFPAFFGR